MRALIVAVLFGVGCGHPPGGSAPQSEPLPAGAIYESPLWRATREWGGDLCRIRRSLPGCETFPNQRLLDVAIDGQRLVALVKRDALDEDGFDASLAVSDDLGSTARAFAVNLPGNG